MHKNIVYKSSTVYYHISGEGEPVVLIHGVPEDGNIWKNQTSWLSNRYLLIVPDLPGSGLSTLLEEMSMDAMAEVIELILKAETISEAVIIGHSMGGYITMAFVEKFPAMLKAFGLFHSSAYADSEEKKVTRKKNLHFIQKHDSYEFIRQSTPGLFSDLFKKDHMELVNGLIETYKNFNPLSLAAYQQAMMDRPDRRKLLEKIIIPVLFVIGVDDKAIPFKDSMEQCHMPALSYIHILKNTGHMGMLEEVEKSNLILERFLQDVYSQ